MRKKGRTRKSKEDESEEVRKMREDGGRERKEG